MYVRIEHRDWWQVFDEHFWRIWGNGTLRFGSFNPMKEQRDLGSRKNKRKEEFCRVIGRQELLVDNN